MNPSPTSSPPGLRSADIHHVDLEGGGGRLPNKPGRPMRDMSRRPPRPSFSRQVSLETGFSALVDREQKSAGGKDGEKRLLSRSGNSLGGFMSTNGRSGGEGRVKGDFSMFRTKSTLSKQNSLLPIRKEVDGDGVGADGLEESAGKSVPNVGRYFAALRGPELDQIKVCKRYFLFSFIILLLYIDNKNIIM